MYRYRQYYCMPACLMASRCSGRAAGCKTRHTWHIYKCYSLNSIICVIFCCSTTAGDYQAVRLPCGSDMMNYSVCPTHWLVSASIGMYRGVRAAICTAQARLLCSPPWRREALTGRDNTGLPRSSGEGMARNKTDCVGDEKQASTDEGCVFLGARAAREVWAPLDAIPPL